MSSTGLIEDLGVYLAANSTRLSIGTSLFGYQLPDSTSNANVSSTQPVATLIPEIGFLPIGRFVPTSGGQPAFERPAVRVRVRSTDGDNGQPSAQPAYAVANEIHRLLEGFPPNSTVAGGTHGRIGAVESFSPPYLEDRDDRGRYEFTFRVVVWDAAP
jgi:hypothetical protein